MKEFMAVKHFMYRNNYVRIFFNVNTIEFLFDNTANLVSIVKYAATTNKKKISAVVYFE